MTPIEKEIIVNALDKARAACDALKDADQTPAVSLAHSHLSAAVEEVKRKIETEHGSL